MKHLLHPAPEQPGHDDDAYAHSLALATPAPAAQVQVQPPAWQGRSVWLKVYRLFFPLLTPVLSLLKELMTSHTPGYDQPPQVQGHVKQSQPKTDPDQPTVYQIRIKGHLGRGWTDCYSNGLCLISVTPGAGSLFGKEVCLHSISNLFQPPGIGWLAPH